LGGLKLKTALFSGARVGSASEGIVFLGQVRRVE